MNCEGVSETCAMPMGSQRPCCWVEPHFRSRPARSAPRSRRTRPRRCAPRGAPLVFADLAARLQPAVVNISTKQRVPVRTQADPFEEFFRRFGGPGRRGQRQAAAAARPRDARGRLARLGLHHLGRRLCRHQQPPDPGRRRGTGTVDSVTVTLTDRKEYPARIIGRDSASDLALAQDRGQQPALRQFRRFAPAPGSATGSSRSAIPTASAAPSPPASSRRFTAESPAPAPMTATSRPTRRSTWAIRAARCSTSTATSSASTRR